MAALRVYWLLLRAGFAVFFVAAAMGELARLDLFSQVYGPDWDRLRAWLARLLPAGLSRALQAATGREAVRYSALVELTLAALLVTTPGPAPLLGALRAGKMLLGRPAGKPGWESALAALALFAGGCALWLGRRLPGRRV